MTPHEGKAGLVGRCGTEIVMNEMLILEQPDKDIADLLTGKLERGSPKERAMHAVLLRSVTA